MIPSIIILGVLLVISTNAQQGDRQNSSSSGSAGLQPWLLGLTAMVVFLFIVFILLIINRVWCKKRKNIDEEENKKERVNMNVYDNAGLDEEELEGKLKEHEENTKAKGRWVEEESKESKVTAM
ncbi:small integral membrane protein 24 [Anomaloglossus baeobatrachus]|uniref:small integral membrane protein 24 n=1 Tax=Anomaloglossus baeobatrachus TaxID=238106 RepID=UPI003F50260E